MSTIRRVVAPTYAVLNSKKKLDLAIKEIIRLKSPVEVSLFGCPDLAYGKIIEWFPERHFFSVQWTRISNAFEDFTSVSDAEMNAFFKIKMLTGMAVFKCKAVRQVTSEIYHYRLPEEIYQQQRRGALRIPLSKRAAFLQTAQSEFELLNLSTGGLRLKIPTESKLKPGSLVRQPRLKLGKKIITSPAFEVSITSIMSDDSGEKSVGGRFAGLTQGEKIIIKQFLVSALQTYFEETK